MTEETKQQIIADYKRGIWTGHEIAAAYDVAYGTVLKIVGDTFVKTRLFRDRQIRERKQRQRAAANKYNREDNLNIPPLTKEEIIDKYNAMGDCGTPSFGERLSMALCKMR